MHGWPVRIGRVCRQAAVAGGSARRVQHRGRGVRRRRRHGWPRGARAAGAERAGGCAATPGRGAPGRGPPIARAGSAHWCGRLAAKWAAMAAALPRFPPHSYDAPGQRRPAPPARGARGACSGWTRRDGNRVTARPSLAHQPFETPPSVRLCRVSAGLRAPPGCRDLISAQSTTPTPRAAAPGPARQSYSRCMTIAVFSRMVPLDGSSASPAKSPPVTSWCG